MRKIILTAAAVLSILTIASAQSKTIIGIVPFKGASQSNNSNNYYYNRSSGSQSQSESIVAIQDAVTDAFLRTKRFSLVERQKMDQIRSEKDLQKNEEFIDGQVIEQSKSLGAQYIVLGNVSKAEEETKQTYAPYAGTITSKSCEVAFNIRVVDVTTGEIVASQSFNGHGKGKNAFENALDKIKPDIEVFIKENFKVVVTLASVEEKNGKGEAVKVLISGGSSTGMREANELKVYEQKELLVDGKKMTRKITIGKIVVAKVEDENFSVCAVTEGGSEIAKKMEAGVKIKCEIIND